MSHEKTLKAFVSLLSAEKGYVPINYQDNKPVNKIANSSWALGRFLKTFTSGGNLKCVVPSLSVLSPENETQPPSDDLRLLVNDIISDRTSILQSIGNHDSMRLNDTEMHQNFSRRIIFSSGDRNAGADSTAWRDAATIPDVLNEHLSGSIRYIFDTRLKYFVTKLIRKQIRRNVAISKSVAHVLSLQVRIDAPSELDDQTLITPFVENWQPSCKASSDENNRTVSQADIESSPPQTPSTQNEDRSSLGDEKEKESQSADDNDFPFDMNERIRKISARVGSCSTVFKILKDEKPLSPAKQTQDEANVGSCSTDDTPNSSIVSIPFTLITTANFHVSFKHGLKVNLIVESKGIIVGKFKDELMEEIELKIDTEYMLDKMVQQVKVVIKKGIGLMVAQMSSESKKSSRSVQSTETRNDIIVQDKQAKYLELSKRRKIDHSYYPTYQLNSYQFIPPHWGQYPSSLPSYGYGHTYQIHNSSGINHPHYQFNNQQADSLRLNHHPSQLMGTDQMWYRQLKDETTFPGYSFTNGYGTRSQSLGFNNSYGYHDVYSAPDQMSNGNCNYDYTWSHYSPKVIDSENHVLRSAQSNPHLSMQHAADRLERDGPLQKKPNQSDMNEDDGNFVKPERRRSKVEFLESSLEFARQREMYESNKLGMGHDGNTSAHGPMMRRRSYMGSLTKMGIDNMRSEPCRYLEDQHERFRGVLDTTAIDYNNKVEERSDRGFNRSKLISFEPPKENDCIDKFNMKSEDSVLYDKFRLLDADKRVRRRNSETAPRAYSDIHVRRNTERGHITQSDVDHQRYTEHFERQFRRRNSERAYMSYADVHERRNSERTYGSQQDFDHIHTNADIHQRRDLQRAYISRLDKSPRIHAEGFDRRLGRRRSEQSCIADGNFLERRNSEQAYIPPSEDENRRIIDRAQIICSNDLSSNDGYVQARDTRYRSIEATPSIIQSGDDIPVTQFNEHHQKRIFSSHIDYSTEIHNRNDNGVADLRRNSFTINSVLAAVELARLSEVESQAGSEISTPSERIRRRSSSAAYAHLVRLLEEEERSKGGDSEISMSTVAELGRYSELEELLRRASAPAMMSAAEAVQRWDRDNMMDRRESEISLFSVADAARYLA